MIRTTVVTLRIDWEDDYDNISPKDWAYRALLGLIYPGEGVEILYHKDYDI